MRPRIGVITTIGAIVLTQCFMGTAQASLATKAEAKTLCEGFLQHAIAGDTVEAFSLVAPHFPIPETELSALNLQVTKQLGIISSRFGKVLGVVFVREESVQDVLLRYTFIQKFENTVIRWVFVFYKPHDTWIMNNLSFDDQVPALFE